jgi:HSP20 family molecular chaperone IbpA
METEIKTNPAEQTDAERTRAGTWYRPLVDIVEKTDELLLIADLPGAKSDSIDIDFEDGVLTVQAGVAPRYDDKMNFLWREYGVGGFHRSFRVSEHIDASRIHADYTGGVLTIHLPKSKAAKPRKIEVQAAG